MNKMQSIANVIDKDGVFSLKSVQQTTADLFRKSNICAVSLGIVQRSKAMQTYTTNNLNKTI